MRRAYISLLVSSCSMLAVGCADPCADDGLLQDTSNEGCAAGDGIGLSDTDGDAGDTESRDAESETDSNSDSMVSDSNDVDSDSESESDTEGGQQWCLDLDGDGFGDPEECTDVPDGGEPPDDSVPNDDDCAPDNPHAFPGAAENEPPPGNEACMEDEDDDGWGDSDPPDGVDPGSDCDDSNPNTFPGAAENEEPPLNEACTQDEDDDGHGDDNPPEGVEPGTDCDDGSSEVITCLSVDAGTCTTFAPPTPATLTADAMGGSGDYSFAWTPAGSLDSAVGQTVNATPANYETYTVTVDDGFSTADDSVTVVSAEPFRLQGACELVQLDVLEGDIGGDASITYNQGGAQACEDLNNDAGLHLCDVDFEDTAFEGVLRVDNLSPNINDGDNDVVGFVWGAQDASNFYSFSWKASDQSGAAGVDVCPDAPNNLWPGGILIKRVEADSVAALTASDIFCDHDTDNSEVLLSPADASLQGWEFGVDYDVTLDYTSMGSNISITGPGGVIADLDIDDNTFPNGRFGTLTFSQSGACSGPWNATCL